MATQSLEWVDAKFVQSTPKLLSVNCSSSASTKSGNDLNNSMDSKIYALFQDSKMECENNTVAVDNDNACNFIQLDMSTRPEINYTDDECNDSDSTIPMREKRSRKTISVIDKEHIIRACLNGEDYYLLGRQMEISRTTVNNIIYRYQKTFEVPSEKLGGPKQKMTEETGDIILKVPNGKRGGYKPKIMDKTGDTILKVPSGKRGGAKPKIMEETGDPILKVYSGNKGGSKPKITEEIGDTILKALDENPLLTLKEMSTIIRERSSTTLSEKTISRFLQNKLIIFKSDQGTVTDRNCLRVRVLRKEYVTRFLDEGWRMEELVYINECSFNSWQRAHRASIKPSECLNGNLPACRNTDISLVLAINKRGPIHFQMIQGLLDKTAYQCFITELCQKLDNKAVTYLIHDNGSIHTGIQTISSLQKIIDLPPYSPFLNPTDSVFSNFKGQIRMKMTQSNFDSQTMEERISSLKSVIETELKDDAYKNLAPYFRRVNKFFARSFELTEIVGD